MPVRWGPLRFVERRPRLASALMIGLLASLLPLGRFVEDEPFRRFLIGWNVTTWSYLLLIGWLFARAGNAKAMAISEREDPSAVVVLAIVAVAAITSLVAIGAELAGAANSADPMLRYALAGITLLGSWLMLNTMFGFHYAHMYFRAPDGARPLRFPDSPQPSPDFWDFMYFSFTIAVATQTADIGVVAPGMRRLVLAHSILAFLFNVAILGATVNVAAGLLGTGAH